MSARARTKAAAAAGGARGPIVLAFSGGLDTSYLVPWLAEAYERPVVTVTVDTGGLDDAAARELEQRARALGAADHLRVDARGAYFDRVLRFLIAGNVRRGRRLPALRRRRARPAGAGGGEGGGRELGSTTVAHGCTARRQRPGALRGGVAHAGARARAARARPRPAAEPRRGGRLSRRARAAGAAVGRRLLDQPRAVGRTIGGRETLGSAEPLPEEAWVLTHRAFAAQLPPATHNLAFERGRADGLDGEALAPVALIERVEAAAAPFGIGRGIHLGDTVLGPRGASPSRRRRPRCCSPRTASSRSWC